MPKKCIKFIPEYLIPNLNNKRFGERLKWVDKSKNIFEIDWRHKSGPEWTEQEAAVFVEWDKHKGHFKPDEKQYYTNSKQRFRALLYKLTICGQLTKLKSATKSKKVFCIEEKKTIRRKKADLNAEYESCNEETSSEEHEYEGIDDMYCRKISEDSTINILEDHSYSISDFCQNNDTDTAHGGENQPVINSQDACVPNVLSESPDNVQKRILMERNYESIFTLMPNACTESFLSYEDSGHETITASMPVVFQNTSFPGNYTLTDSFSLDLSEILRTTIFETFEEKK